jgi:aspartyl protease family protein
MSGDQTAQLVGAVMMLVLVGSSLFARRLPLGQTVRMVLAWLLIFAAVLIGYSYRFELGSVWERVTGDVLGDRGRTVGDTFRVPMAEDGHFWVRAWVNGEELRFLIDSGATSTALSEADARAAGLEIDEADFPVTINTANGAVSARRARIATLTVGPITARNMSAVVSPAFGRTNVLGMNFLSSLESWRVENGALILRPRSSSTVVN